MICSGLSIPQIVRQETLALGKEADSLQIQALTAVLPVCLKVLSVAGSSMHIETFGPRSGCNCPGSLPNSRAGSADAAGASVPEVWLMLRPGHYDVVYPSDGFKRGCVEVRHYHTIAMSHFVNFL